VYGALASDGREVTSAETALGVLDPLDRRSAYPEAKRICENLLVSAGHQYGLSGDIVRLSHTYGPGFSGHDNRVQVEFLTQAVTGQTIIMKSDGRRRRHYTYAADAASGVVRILLTHRQRNQPEAFNVADNASRISIRQLAEMALVAAGRDPGELVVAIQAPPDQLWSRTEGDVFLDTTKLEALGWKPSFTLEAGLERMAQYIRDLRGII
jgi:nucleoside-diphosphate-sugar epimerase